MSSLSSPVISLTNLLLLLGHGDHADLSVLRPDILDDVLRGPGQQHVRSLPAPGPGDQEESFQGRQEAGAAAHPGGGGDGAGRVCAAQESLLQRHVSSLLGANTDPRRATHQQPLPGRLPEKSL